MSIIKTHDTILFKKQGGYEITLHPLTDEYFPYLCKWNADVDVLYWCEADDVIEPYPAEMVQQIYGGVSQNAHCFIIEVNGTFIGECWLQKMNLPKVMKLYNADTDVRRIDMSIGEKEYWGKGIGTIIVKMLIDFAFLTEKVDFLHCISEDYNIRSRRVWEKNGFTNILTEPITNSSKAKSELHWQLKRDDYLGAQKDTQFKI